MIAARLGCAIRTKKTGEETFVQIHTDESLLECRVLASAIGANEAEATAKAMALAGVTELVRGPRPISGAQTSPERVRSFLGGLAACELAIDELLGVIRGH